MKISVVIPCRNEKRHIGEFLDSLLMQELDRDWQVEILVADGLSDDGTREVLSQYSQDAPQVRMIDNPGRIVSTGLNAAITAAAGDVIIRMDAHTVYARDYIRECMRALQTSGADNVGGPWVAEGRGMIGRAIAAAFRSPFCTTPSWFGTRTMSSTSACCGLADESGNRRESSRRIPRGHRSRRCSGSTCSTASGRWR